MARLRPEQGPKRLRRLAQERGMRSFVQEGQRDLSADFDVPSGRGFIALLEAFRATGGTAPVRSWASCWKSIRPAKPPASPSSVRVVWQPMDTAVPVRCERPGFEGQRAKRSGGTAVAVVGVDASVMVCRTERTTAWPQSSRHARLGSRCCHAGCAVAGIGQGIDTPALAGYFKLQALPVAYYGWLMAILLGYCLLTTLMKRVYIRRYGWQ